jgi:hypothetical protein
VQTTLGQPKRPYIFQVKPVASILAAYFEKKAVCKDVANAPKGEDE